LVYFRSTHIRSKLTYETCFALLNVYDEAHSDFIRRKNLNLLRFSRIGDIHSSYTFEENI